LDDFKAHLRVSGTAEDTALVRFLDTAARALEDDARRLLLTGTVKEYYDVWPWDYVEVLHLSRAPVVSLTSVTYYDTADVLQTWAATNYVADVLSEPARLVLAELATVTSPSIDQRPNAVVVEYQCGYGATVANLPPESINAIFVKASYLYARGRELGTSADAEAVERCWQNEIRRLTWSML
jgi:uncharacterized phiE125 gp8 family phage protein